MIAKNFTLCRKYNGTWYATFDIASESVKDAQNIADQFHESEFDVDIRKHKERRTLTANAYFHVLVNKIASVLNTSNEDCKKWLVRSYGTVAEDNGIPVMITLPKGTDPDDFYPYSEWMYGDDNGDTFQLYKQTHMMNTKEFSRLLDGTIQECKTLHIETLSEGEIRRLYAQADKIYNDTKKRERTCVGT